MPHSTSIPTPGISSDWNGSLSKDSGFALVHIFRQEPTRIIARQPHHGLRQVIRAEREELSHFRNLVGEQSGPRKLDHRTDEIVKFYFSLLQ